MGAAASTGTVDGPPVTSSHCIDLESGQERTRTGRRLPTAAPKRRSVTNQTRGARRQPWSATSVSAGRDEFDKPGISINPSLIAFTTATVRLVVSSFLMTFLI